jgi:hypothetical protein
MAKLWNSEITIIHVKSGKSLSPLQESSKALLVKRLKGLKLNFVEVGGHTKISEAIMFYVAENEKIGMIAVINFWHSFFAKLIKEDVIKRMAFYTGIPLLIFPFIDSK